MIKLRALEPTDLDILYALENEQELWPSSNTHTPYSRFTLEQFIITTQNDLFVDRQLRLVVVDVAENNNQDEMGTNGEMIVGLVDLCNFNPQHSRAEVSMAILNEHRHKGFGKASLMALVEFVRQNLRLHQLYAIVSTDNIPAQKTFIATGFHQSGVMKDWISANRDAWFDAQLLQLIL